MQQLGIYENAINWLHLLSLNIEKQQQQQIRLNLQTFSFRKTVKTVMVLFRLQNRGFPDKL